MICGRTMFRSPDVFCCPLIVGHRENLSLVREVVLVEGSSIYTFDLRDMDQKADFEPNSGSIMKSVQISETAFPTRMASRCQYKPLKYISMYNITH